MRKIPKTFKKNGYNYTLLKRIKDLVLYEQFKDFKSEGSAYAYEIHKVKISPHRSVIMKDLNGTLKKIEFPEKECLASNEDFGRCAWSFKGKSMALDFLGG